MSEENFPSDATHKEYLSVCRDGGREVKNISTFK